MTNAASVVTENGMSLVNFYSGEGFETFSVLMSMYKLFGWDQGSIIIKQLHILLQRFT
jgi:hypothetical protein